MADTPVILRGKMYNTRRVYRCPNFSQCHMCKQCDNYNPHNALCTWCEGSKNPALLCHHDDAQQQSYLQVQLLFGRPMTHVDDREPVENASEKSLHNESALMQAEEALGRMNMSDATEF